MHGQTHIKSKGLLVVYNGNYLQFVHNKFTCLV